jgi:archaellum component FlaC
MTMDKLNDLMISITNKITKMEDPFEFQDWLISNDVQEYLEQIELGYKT